MLVIMYSGEICTVPGSYRRLCRHNVQIYEPQVGELVPDCAGCQTPVGYLLTEDKDGDTPADRMGNIAVDYLKARVVIQYPYVSETE